MFLFIDLFEKFYVMEKFIMLEKCFFVYLVVINLIMGNGVFVVDN